MAVLGAGAWPGIGGPGCTGTGRLGGGAGGAAQQDSICAVLMKLAQPSAHR